MYIKIEEKHDFAILHVLAITQNLQWNVIIFK